MATKIYGHGSATVAVPSGEKITVFSNGPYKVYQQVGYPNLPTTWDLLDDGVAGATYLSAAFSAAATVRIDMGPDFGFYETGTAPVVAEPMADQEFADATGVIIGLAAAQGGSSTLKGGTSSTSANAGGASSLLGGQPGLTGVGGAVAATGGAGGATSGAGGAVTLAGGTGTAGNSAGGAASLIGGAGQGTAAGGAASLVGGASGAGATGNGGAIAVTGGAAASTNGNGGSVVLNGGALAGTGIKGHVHTRGLDVGVQGAPTAKTTAVTLTIAEMLTGIITGTHAAGATQAYTLPTGTLVDAALVFANDDYFKWSLINLSAAAIDTITLTAGATHSIVGNPIIQSAHSTTGGITGNSVMFLTRKTAANTYITYRIAG